MAEFGSELEKDHRKQEGALEQAWGKSTGVGSQTGLWVWRIENFQVVAVPKADQGKFYNGDSYIILNVWRQVFFVLPHIMHVFYFRSLTSIMIFHFNSHTRRRTQTLSSTISTSGSERRPARTRPALLHTRLSSLMTVRNKKKNILANKGTISYFVWQPPNPFYYSSPRKKPPISDLDGRPIQHREVQGHESKQLLSYFRTFSTLSGGVKTGFHHWTAPEYPARLLMVKSAPIAGGHKSSVVVREVTKDFINTGDVFVLDTGKVLYQWNGKKSSGIEKVKAAEYAHGIEADRAGDVNVETFGNFFSLCFYEGSLRNGDNSVIEC